MFVCSAASVASQVVFKMARNSNYSQPQTMIPLPVEVVNPQLRYYNSTFISTVEGIHFVEVCVGVPNSSPSLVSTDRSTFTEWLLRSENLYSLLMVDTS